MSVIRERLSSFFASAQSATVPTRDYAISDSLKDALRRLQEILPYIRPNDDGVIPKGAGRGLPDNAKSLIHAANILVLLAGGAFEDKGAMNQYSQDDALRLVHLLLPKVGEGELGLDRYNNDILLPMVEQIIK